MYSILKSAEYISAGGMQADTTAASQDPNPADPWLFTDPAACEFYCQHGQIGALEDDISTYVMVDGQWSQEDLEYKNEIRRLLQEDLIAARSSYGYLSPHPTVYTATGEGELNIAGERYVFESGDDIMYEPWLARLAHPALCGPASIGRANPLIQEPSLCREAFPQVSIQCDHTRAIMRQILSYRHHGN